MNKTTRSLCILVCLSTILAACRPQVRITEKEIVITRIATKASTALPTHTPLPTHTSLPKHTLYPTSTHTQMPSIPTNTPTNTKSPDTIVSVVNSDTRLRTGPGLIYDITQVLDAGQELTVIAKHVGVDDGLGWLLIEINTLQAWIAERTINWESGSLGGIPESANIPPTPTALPTTNTALPPTYTPAPATSTSIPPTAIPPTIAPPTNTPLPQPTNTPPPT